MIMVLAVILALAAFVGPDKGQLPGVVTAEGDVAGRLEIRAEGFADIATKRSMATNTLFWIASNTKGIAAATALQALADDGRERGLLAGANVLMPNVTDTRFRRSYQLYEGKPALDETAADARAALDRRLAALGESIAYGVRGDSPHYHRRTV